MSEIDGERRIEATIDKRIEAGAGYSPALNRLFHQRTEDLVAALAADANEDRLRFEPKTECNCYPSAWHRLLTPAERAEAIAELTFHHMRCPLWVDYHPAYQPSYTRLQERRDDEQTHNLTHWT